jgi:hypothetical protein
MRKSILHALSLTVLVFCSYNVIADTDMNKEKQFEHGNKMHDEHCNKCHTDKVYTRDNRFVKTLDALSTQVTRCKNNTGAPWFEEDTDAVVHFLNEKYYKF